MGVGSYASRCWLFYLTLMRAKHGGVPQAATGLSEAREEAERQRALDKSHTPNLWMFLNDSPDGLSFLTELLLRAERVLTL